MTRSGAVTLTVTAAALLGVMVWNLRRDTPPSCTSEEALNGAYAALHDRYQLDSIFLNNIRTIDGGWFSRQFECSAEVATIRGNEDLVRLQWRSVHYTVMHVEGVPNFAVLADLGGPTPFVRKKPSFWERLIAGP